VVSFDEKKMKLIEMMLKIIETMRGKVPGPAHPVHIL
jgi:hypothetical protein